MNDMLKKIEEAKEYLLTRLDSKPEIGLILGSGLGVMANEIKNPTIIKYDDVPYFLKSTVEGHAGQFVIGNLNGKEVIAMQGRFHFYEGYSMKEITFPVRLMKAIGVEKLILTNAAGGVNTNYEPGDLMVISDHINFSGDNPLMGVNYNELGARFPDASNIYKKEIRLKIKEVAKSLSIGIQEGVYMFNTGPVYETPAEIRMARVLGADAVGMSTAPEAIVAAHAGMDVAGISCITNMAAGILDQPLNHDEVIETAEKVRNQFVKLVNGIIEVM
ncbi:purine-nucleoside phosphorylase [Clostridiaceae bacterium HSG29]|nr:purine-nucleoside phosphorylase [Clostridiaceae bacterium HSG29]